MQALLHITYVRGSFRLEVSACRCSLTYQEFYFSREVENLSKDQFMLSRCTQLLLKLTLKFALNWDGQLLMEAFNGHHSCLLSRRPKVGTRILTGHKGRSFVRMLCTR
jgi:hypothetical protein